MSNFHSKFHRHNHHTSSTGDARYPDATYDPIASKGSPFQGDFYLVGGLSATGELSATSFKVAGAAAARKYATTIGDGLTSVYVVTHNLSTADVITQVHDTTTFEVSYSLIKNLTTQTVYLSFVNDLGSSAARVVVCG